MVCEFRSLSWLRFFRGGVYSNELCFQLCNRRVCRRVLENGVQWLVLLWISVGFKGELIFVHGTYLGAIFVDFKLLVLLQGFDVKRRMLSCVIGEQEAGSWTFPYSIV